MSKNADIPHCFVIPDTGDKRYIVLVESTGLDNTAWFSPNAHMIKVPNKCIHCTFTFSLHKYNVCNHNFFYPWSIWALNSFPEIKRQIHLVSKRTTGAVYLYKDKLPRYSNNLKHKGVSLGMVIRSSHFPIVVTVESLPKSKIHTQPNSMTLII